MIDINNLNRWRVDNGDNTHNLNYDLSESSIVIDIGGYTGVWASQIIEKYNPNVYIIEPISDFFKILETKFNSDKVNLLNKGIGIKNEDKNIYKNLDDTSTRLNTGTIEVCKFITIDSLLKEFNIDDVDLVQINIEGDEYDLLDYMFENKLIRKFKNIQIQFHLNIDNCIQRREDIRNKLLENNFEINFDYPFVWESWKRI